MIKKLDFYNIYKILFLIMFGYISVIDSVNGYVMYNFGFGVSIVIRSLVLLIFIVYLFKYKSSRKMIYLYTLVGYLLIVGLGNIFIYKTYGGLFNEVSTLSKLLFIIVSIESFNAVITSSIEKKKIIDKVIDLNIILFPLCVIIPKILNVGLDVYSGNIGTKGFFNSNNELAIILSCILVFSVAKLYKKFDIKNIVTTLLITYSVLLVSSKIGMVTLAIIFLVYFIKSLINFKTKKEFAIMIIISGVLGLILFNKQIFGIINSFIMRQQMLYEVSNSSLLYTLLGGRNEFVELIYDYSINSSFGFSKLIFGYGIHIKELILGGLFNEIGALKTIEMDFFDILFSYGIVGVTLIYGYFVQKLIKYKDSELEYKIAFAILILIGAISGHVLFNAMAGSFLVIVLCGMIIDGKINSDIKRDEYIKSGKRKILLISNMYPSEKAQNYGVFVKNTEDILKKDGFEIDKIVITKQFGKLAKLSAYFKHYVKIIVSGITNEYDAIYVHYASHNAIPLIILNSLKLNIKICTNVHGGDVVPRKRINSLLQGNVKMLLQISDVVIVPSNNYKGLVRDKFDLDENKIKVFPSGGINKEKFYPEHLEYTENKCIGFVGRIESKKGWEVFLQIVSEIKDLDELKGYKYIVVGDGDQSTLYESMIKDLDLDNIVEKHKVLGQSKLREIYNRMDIFCFPTYNESLGLVGIEAMACGVPVIGSRVGGLQDYILEGENGYLFEVANIEEAKQKILQYISLSVDEKTKLKENAVKTSEKYEVNNIDSILINIFEQICRK